MDPLRLDADAVVWNRPPGDRSGRPLLVLLHGLGGTEHDLTPFVSHLPAEYTIAAVRGPIPAPPGWGWYPRRPDQAGVPLTEIAAHAADALLDWIRQQRGVPAVDLMGFSQGASVAVHALRRDPGAVRAVVALAGFLVRGRQDGDAALRARTHPAFFGHGGRDDVIPPRDADRLQAWLGRHTALEDHRYPDLDHWMADEQLQDVGAFLRRVLRERPS